MYLARPTLADLTALARALTGREPTAEELERATAILASRPSPSV